MNAGAAITVFEVITAVAFHLFAQTPGRSLRAGGRARRPRRRDQRDRAARRLRDHLDLAGPPRAAGRHAGRDRRREGRHPQAAACRWRSARSPTSRGAILLAHAAARRRAGAAARAGTGHVAPQRAGSAITDATRRARPAAARAAGRASDDNAGIAIAALRASRSRICPTRRSRAASRAPNGRRGCSASTARSPRLLPPDWELWLDGGHNPGAGEALAAASGGLVGPAAAPRRRHEAGQGLRRVPAPAAAARAHASGRSRSRASIWRCRWRRSSRPPAASPGRARRVAEALDAIPRDGAPRARADLRQPLSCRRGPETGWCGLRCLFEQDPAPRPPAARAEVPGRRLPPDGGARSGRGAR